MGTSATGFQHSLSRLPSRHTEVRNLDVLVLVKKQIFWLQVSMTDIEAVTIIDRMNDLLEVVKRFAFRQSAPLNQVIEEFTPWNVFHDQKSDHEEISVMQSNEVEIFASNLQFAAGFPDIVKVENVRMVDEFHDYNFPLYPQ